jgi:hypothetical protein
VIVPHLSGEAEVGLFLRSTDQPQILYATKQAESMSNEQYSSFLVMLNEVKHLFNYEYGYVFYEAPTNLKSFMQQNKFFK